MPLGRGVPHLLQPRIQLRDDVLRDGAQLGPQAPRWPLPAPAPRGAVGADLLLVCPHPRAEAVDVAGERRDVALRLPDARGQLRERALAVLRLRVHLLQLARDVLLAALVRLDAALQLGDALAVHADLVLPGVLLHVELVELLVGFHELGFHGVHQVHLPGDGLVHRLDGGPDLVPRFFLVLKPAFPLLLVLQQPLQPQELDLQLDLEDLLPERAVGFRLLRLGLQGSVAAAHLVEDALHVAHVLFRLFQLPLRFLAPDAKARDAGRLLEDEAPLLGLRGQELVDLALLHDGVGGLADSRVEEQLADLAQLDDVPLMKYSLSPER